MKKLLLLLCIALLNTSCRNVWVENYAAVIWTVCNDTEHTLVLKCPYYDTGMPDSNPMLSGDLEFREFEIGPNQGINICKGMVPRDSKPWLDYYFEKSAEAFGDDVSWQILSGDGTELKRWNYSDRGKPNQRFFEESEWRAGRSGVCDLLIFTVTSEDP